MNKNSYKDLTVWKKATDLAVAIYSLTETFPKEERFGIISQMRRSAVSIPSNIAEGKLRSRSNEWRHFLLIAYGSAGELETQIEIAIRLGYMKESNCEQVLDLMQEVMKMLNVMTGTSANAYRLSPKH